MTKMSSFKQGIAIAVFTVALSGCATNGGEQGGFSSALETAGGAFQGVATGLGSVVGGVFQPYRNGVQVKDEQLAKLTKGMSVEEVEKIIGYPPEVKSANGGEIWSYPYTEMRHFGGNTNETTVIRFDTAGKLAKAYKTNTRSSASGNPLLDAANGVQ